jgi:hypothetical protein
MMNLLNRQRCVVAVLAVLSITVSAPNAVAGERPNAKDRSVSAKLVPGRPDPAAPTLELVPDDGKDRPGSSSGQGFTVQAASFLPFNFSYDFSTSLASRSFWPSFAGMSCVALRATGSTDPDYWQKELKVEMWDAFGTDTRIGPPVRYSANGYYYGYCWFGLSPYHEHYFKLTKDWGVGTARLWGNGWASAI